MSYLQKRIAGIEKLHHEQNDFERLSFDPPQGYQSLIDFISIDHRKNGRLLTPIALLHKHVYSF